MSTYKRHRFPPEIISYAVWLYFRFNLSYRDIEDLLAERGIEVNYESIRNWCLKFGPKFAKRFRNRRSGFGDAFFIDEVFVKIGGKQHYLWRAVDQDGDVVDVLIQSKRNTKAASREMSASWIHDADQYSNNRAEQSHIKTRIRERSMKLFRSVKQAKQFLIIFSVVYNLFNLARHTTIAENYRELGCRELIECKGIAVYMSIF